MVTSSPAQPGRLLAVLVCAPLLYQVDVAIVNVAAPAIRTGLGATDAALELVVGGYAVSSAVLIIPGARLGRAHGYQRMFRVGMALFGVTSLLCGLAPTATALVAARLLQGAAGALMFPQALTGIQLGVDAEHRTRAVGVYALALSSGAIAGQLLGGLLIEADLPGLHWRTVFLVNVPICALVLLAARHALPPRHPVPTGHALPTRHAGAAPAVATHGLPDARRRLAGRGPLSADRVHLPSVATLGGTVLVLIVPLDLGRTLGWPVWSWLCLAASGPAAALFLTVQRRAADRGWSPLVNVAMLGNPAVWPALLSLFLATSTYLALLFALAQYVQLGLRASAVESGLLLVGWVAAFGAAGRVLALLPTRVARFAPSAGCLLLAAAYLAISATRFAGWTSPWALAALLTLGGYGLGTNFGALLTHLTRSVAPGQASDISGTSTMNAQVGGAFGVAAFGSLYLALAPVYAPARVAERAFGYTTMAEAAVALLACGFSLLAVRRHPPMPDAGRAPRPERTGTISPRPSTPRADQNRATR